MVVLNLDLIARGTSGYTKRRSHEELPCFLKRLTHLHLDNKNIDSIGNELGLCRNLTVLYLYDNSLTSVPALSQNQHITHLYLQNNYISGIENLHHLAKLQKLYVGGNAIAVVEGLENLHNLEELHIENQRLPPGEKLVFDPRSLKSLQTCIKVLNISGNQLDSIEDLSCLSELMQLICNNNILENFQELAHVLPSFNKLWRLELTGNPVCHITRYRERFIVMCNPALEILDGKQIPEASKRFLRNWQDAKDARRKREETLVPPSEPETLARESSKRFNLWPHKSAGYMMQGFRRPKQFDEIMAKCQTTGPGGDSLRPTNYMLPGRRVASQFPPGRSGQTNFSLMTVPRPCGALGSAPSQRQPPQTFTRTDAQGNY